MLPTSECVPDFAFSPLRLLPPGGGPPTLAKAVGGCSLKLLQALFILSSFLLDADCAPCPSTVSLLFAHRYEVDDIDEEGKE